MLKIHPSTILLIPFNFEFILISKLIIFLAQVWSYGLELKRDQVLTI